MSNLQEKDLLLQTKTKEKRNYFKTFLGLIVSPGKTMETIEANPSILFPLLINSLGWVVLALLRFPIFRDYYMPKYMPNVTAFGKKAAMIQILAIAPIQDILPWLIYSVLYFAIIKLLKGKGTFKQIVSVTGYSYVVIVLYFVVCFFSSFFTNSLEFNASLSFLINIFMPGIKDSMFYRLVDNVSIAMFWQFVLIAIGINKVTKLSKVKTHSLVFASYAFIVLVNTFFATYVN